MIIHPLHTNIPKPERFTWPFCYEPHPLCLLACDEVKQEIERIGPKEGKMFGVLVVEVDGGLGFLAAYSGLLEGRNDWGYFVPPVFDAQQPDGYFKQKEREISALNQHPSPDKKCNHYSTYKTSANDSERGFSSRTYPSPSAKASVSDS